MTKMGHISLWQVAGALIAITLASAFVSAGRLSIALGAMPMFFLAAIKAELVLSQFMEVSAAERHWRWLYRIWIAVVTAILATGMSQ